MFWNNAAYFDSEEKKAYFGNFKEGKKDGVFWIYDFSSFEGSEKWSSEDDVSYDRFDFDKNTSVVIYNNDVILYDLKNYPITTENPFEYKFLQNGGFFDKTAYEIIFHVF